jgi:pseudaminic acid synthase
MTSFAIADTLIGTGHPPYIIAELSGNHNGSLERALAIVEAAAQAGAHALKIQTYTADTMTLDLAEGSFHIQDPGSLWQGNSLYQLYQRAYTPWEWHQPLFARCRELGMAAFSTPFDASAVDFLESLQVPCYKIASFENIDLPLIKKVAATGKPLIISTGMATLAELAETVQTARDAGCQNLVLLKCTSTYPAAPAHSNLLTIPSMRDLFACPIGLSDHTLGIGVAVASVALGAAVIEKHVTLSREDGGVDAAFSLEPHELQQLVSESKRAWQALGGIHFGPVASEKSSLQFRLSLYITQDLKAGDRLSRENVRAIRPGLGLPPKFLEWLLDKPIGQDVAKGTPMSLELLWPR